MILNMSSVQCYYSYIKLVGFYGGVLLPSVEVDIGDLEERLMRKIAGLYRIFFIDVGRS